MSVDVIIPFAGEDVSRKRALEWVVCHCEWRVVLGEGDPEKWCKANAVADALTLSTADVLVIADGDVWTPKVADAVAAVERGARWAVPHKTVRRLDQASTELVLAGAAPSEEMPLDRPAYKAAVGGGIVVLTRELYNEIPLDPRFVGWGSEDYSWGYALTTITGAPRQFTGPLWHLWHTPQPRDKKFKVGGSAGNDELRKRYRAARRDVTRMKKLIDEI